MCASMHACTQTQNIGVSEGVMYQKILNSGQDLGLGILNACHMLLTSEALEPWHRCRGQIVYRIAGNFHWSKFLRKSCFPSRRNFRGFNFRV